MALSAKKEELSLDDVIFMVVSYACKDLLHIALVFAHYGTGEILDEGSGMIASVPIVIGKVLHTTCNELSILRFFVSIRKNYTEVPIFVSERDVDEQSVCAQTIKQKSLFAFAVIVTYLQYASSNWEMNAPQLATTSYLEINQRPLMDIDIPIVDFNGITFVKLPEVKANKKDNSHLLLKSPGSTYPLIVSNRILTQNVSLSNSTDTALRLSADARNSYDYILSVCSVVLVYVIVMVDGIPAATQTLKDTANVSLKRAKRSLRSFVVDLKGGPNTGYCADMSFGVSDTTQEFCMLVDTGSSNLAVAATPLPGVKEYLNTLAQEASSSLINTDKPVTVTYSGGEWSGTLARDLVSIGGSPSVELEFALIQSSTKFFIPGAEWVGILGLAYDSLAKPDSSVTPFWSVLHEFSGLRDMFSLRICPPINFANQGGILEFGDVSDTLYTGPILYTSVVEELYYNVLVTNLTIGDIKIDLHCSEFNNDKAIVDSGTTDIYLPSNAFTAVVAAFRKHFKEHVPLEVPDSFWEGGSKLSWPTESKDVLFEAFPVFYIGLAEDGVASSEFALAVTPQTYLRQVSGSQEEMEETECLPQCDFYVLGIKSREKGMVIGGNVMLGFTTVFDRERKRVGFAKSTCSYADTTPGHIPYITGPYPREPVDCECYGCSRTIAYWEWIVYVCGAVVSLICITSIGYTVILKCYRQRFRISACCHRGCTCTTCDRRNAYSTRNVVATEETAVSLERQSSVQSEDSGIDSHFVSRISGCSEEENSSTAASVVSPSFATNNPNSNNMALLTIKQHNPILTYLPDMKTLQLSASVVTILLS